MCLECVLARFSAAILVFLLIGSLAAAGANDPVKPGPGDKCPVCGMFAAKYPEFLSQMVFRDGSSAFFDGPKDLFKCYLNRSRYLPSKNKIDVAALFVKDYYSLAVIDARTAFFVVGSDIRGPMGSELIPFRKKAEAAEFQKDHQGKRTLRFNEVTAFLLKEME